MKRSSPSRLARRPCAVKPPERRRFIGDLPSANLAALRRGRYDRRQPVHAGRAVMKSILVPTEHGADMVAALDTALLLAQKFGSCIEGFPMRPAIADMVAMDPDTGLTMLAVKENDADMVRQAEDAVSRLHGAAQAYRNAATKRRPRCHGRGSPPRRAATTSSAATAACSTSSSWRGRATNGRARPWSRSNPRCSKAAARS